jgi:hypothetical protein
MRRAATALILCFAAAIAACSSTTGSGGTTGGGGATTGTHVVGDACVATSDCAAGLFCSTDDPGGQCLATCAAAADCPAGSVCTDEMKCYKSCTAASDCTRSGYACVDAMTVTSMPTQTCDVAPDGDAG